MKGYLVRNRVPAEAIYTDNKGNNTYLTAVNSKGIMDKPGSPEFVKVLALFGHACIIAGYYLAAWDINLLPVSITPPGILSRPLFCGMFNIRGILCQYACCVQVSWRRTAGETVFPIT